MQLDYRTLHTYRYEKPRKSPSSVPRRASAHPEAIAPVRHKYRNSDQIEIIEVPTRPMPRTGEQVDRSQRRSLEGQLSCSLPIEEIDTLSPEVSEPRVPAASAREPHRASITTVLPRQHEPTPAFNVFDRVRWWLLYPNRLEFLLWLVGTVLLISTSVVVILVVLLSAGVR